MMRVGHKDHSELMVELWHIPVTSGEQIYG